MNTRNKYQTIKFKLLVLAISVAAILFILGLSSYIYIKRINEIRELSLKINKLDNQVLQARRAEKDFMLREPVNVKFFKTGKSNYIEKFESKIDICHDLLKELKQNNFIEDFEIEKELKEMDISLKKYHGRFIDYTFGVKEKGFLAYGLIGKMREAVHKMETTANQQYHKEPKILNYILTLRRHEKDYLLRNDEKYVEKLKETKSNLEKYLHNNYSQESLNNNGILDNLDDYLNDFIGVADITNEIGIKETEGLQGELRTAVHAVEPIITELLEVIDSESQKVVSGTITMLVILSLLSLIIVILITSYIIYTINKSITQAQKIIQTVSEGDFTKEIEDVKGDEIGVILSNLKSMISKLKEVLVYVRNSSDNIAATSVQLSSSSQEMNASSQQVSQGANEQASSVEEVSSSMEQMVANIQQNTENARQTEIIALKAASSIKDGNENFKATVDAMKLIANKISVVGEIASKTDLLAINAAVEAARAGEHGKGFSVVASEIRKLSERTRNAAIEIDEISNSSLSIAEISRKSLEQLVPEIQKTSELVQEITSASVEQNSGAEQVNGAVQQLNLVTQQNSGTSEEMAASAEEMAASAEELSNQAEKLKEIISFFRLNDEKYDSKTKQKPTRERSKIASSKAYIRNDNSTKTDQEKEKMDTRISDNPELITDKDFDNF